MTLQEAEKRLSELNGEINRLLKERENVLRDWNTAFYTENPESIVCIDQNIDDIVHKLYLVNGDSMMFACLFSERDMQGSIGEYYKCIDMSMKMHNMANGREMESPDYQKNLVYAKAAEIRENYMAKPW